MFGLELGNQFTYLAAYIKVTLNDLRSVCWPGLLGHTAVRRILQSHAPLAFTLYIAAMWAPKIGSIETAYA